MNDAQSEPDVYSAQSDAPAPQAPKPKAHFRALKFTLAGVLIGVLAALVLSFAPGSPVRKFFNKPNETSTAQAQPISIEASGEDLKIASAVASKCLPSVVSVQVESREGQALGSGVILDNEGNIITNYHVVAGALAVSVDVEGKTYDAKIVGSDASSDIAVIKADFGDAHITPIEVGNSDDLVVGDWIMTIGSPFGLDQSVSAGIVSALYRSTVLTSEIGDMVYSNLIQIDAAINEGNSGGALVNEKGELVGINTLLESSSGDFSGIGFAIPGNYAVNIAQKIIEGKTVTHAYIGISMATVNSQNYGYSGLAVDKGAFVAEVTKDGPADKAGIRVGDVITKVDDTAISSADSLMIAIRSHEEGDTVKVTLNRSGKEKTVEVTLGNDQALQLEKQKLLNQESDSPLFDFGN